MHLFIFSPEEQSIDAMQTLNIEIKKISDSNPDLETFQFESSIVIIDINSLKDMAFTLASKISILKSKPRLILGVTSADIDSRGSKFDFFFQDFNEIVERFDEVKNRYEQVQ